MMQTQPTADFSDSFGQNQSVRINLTRKTSASAKAGAVLAFLLPVPAAPAVGAALGFRTRANAKNDATLDPGRAAPLAIRVGVLFSALQALCAVLVGQTVWNTLEEAKSIAVAHAAAGAPDAMSQSGAAPSATIALLDVLPGSTGAATVTGLGEDRRVELRFGTTPAWNGMGFVFEAEVVGPGRVAEYPAH